MRADNIVSCVPALVLSLMLSACGFVDSGGSQDPPPASAGPDRTVQEAARVVLDASALVDVGGIASFRWTQTGGTPLVTLANALTPTASFTAPTVQQRTILEFTLTTTDDFGASNSATVQITINDKPTANAGADRTVTRGTEAVLQGGASADSDGRITRFAWRQTAGTQVTLTGATTANPRFTVPLTAQPGEVLTFSLIVTDSDGARATDTVSITVNAPPVANAGVNQIVTEGQRVTLNGTGSTDPEGNPLRFQWVQTDDGLPVVLTGATTATPSFTAPQVLIQRILTFQLTVTDSAGATAIDSVAITVRLANLRPVAVNDAYSVNEGGTLFTGLPAGVLANDTDPEGDPLTAELFSDVSHGDLTLGPGGAVTYTHDGSETTSDSFTYRARDSAGNVSNLATVSITINPVNEAPAFTSSPVTQATENQLYTYDITTSDPDLGDTRSVTATSLPPSWLTLAPTGNGTATLSGTPGTGDVGGSVNLRVQDSAGLFADQSFTITVEPAGTDEPLSACWTTPPAQTLTATLGSGAQRATAAQQPQQYALVTNGKKGTATLIDSTSGTITYTPSSVSARGSDTFKYKTEGADGKARYGEVTVIIDPRVMPLGGSITAGVTNGAAQLPVPEARVGYRKPLQQKLSAAGYRMDFVGTQPLGAGVAGFDYQSEAHTQRSVRELAMGSKAKDLEYPNTGVYAWLEQNPADFVLLHMGSENLQTASVDDVETVLDEIDRWERDHNARVRVLLARVIDRAPRDPRIAAFNNQVQAMAKDRVANPANPAYPDRIRMVNQQAALSYPADLSDGVHPNAAGYTKMADAWARAIRAECKPPPGEAVK